MKEDLTRKPFICGTFSDGLSAGFLNVVTGQFEKCCDIRTELDIDDFISEYDLSCVCISKSRVPQAITISA